MKNKIEKLVTMGEFKKETYQLWKNFEKYCAYKHLQETKDIVIPAVK